ncbi:MAG: DUF2953 domain-containing protein [Hespellia sp.]|nr:DUF2953 domain-containing protein [Hespellia sp.]
MAILGLIVLLLLIVLLVPLRYQMTGEGAGSIKSLQGKMKFSWLLHLVSGYVSYQDQKLEWNVRIAWKWLGGKDTATVDPVEEEPITIKPVEEEPVKEEPVTVEPVAIEAVEENVTEKAEAEIEPAKMDVPEKIITAQEKKEEPRVSIFIRVSDFYKKIKYTFRRICDNMKALMATKDKLEAFLTDEIHKAAFARGMKELKRFLRFLKPKRFHLNAHIGFEDPSLTGKMLAGLSILYPFVGKNHLCVTPEFEQEIYEGDMMIRGHIRVVYVIIMGWNLIWDKNIRMTYKHIKNFKK